MVPMDFEVGMFGAGHKEGLAESLVELALNEQKKKKQEKQEAQLVSETKLPPLLKMPPLKPGYIRHIGPREPIMARDI
ncbi:MAG: hypothetical protein QG620_285 [Patescibacteria group bacterium]|nr:hypothetical protein [Patescibacteria group bacterium]